MRYPASTCAIALATALAAAPAIAEVLDLSKYPDFQGQWDRVGPPNNWRQLGGPPPLTPEYQKVYDAKSRRSARRPARQLAIDLLRSGGDAGVDEPL